MSSIDERIVRMQFDNKKFEENAKTSMNTLEKLKKSLNMDSATKSLGTLQKSVSSFSMTNLANNVETIASRFTNLGIVGVTALQNIANRAIQTGEQLLKSLTIDPITTGLSEYETKMNSIQTILTNTASKGTTLDDVNKALNELNKYADQTIYNFADMTRNIGAFTAAGVDLDTSVASIKGIANLAAGSGSTPQQAATAMYQLSQAIAAGRVSLQDWNSVVNAGMGGEYFQNALKQTAREMGIVVDESESFRESISTAGGKESWLTSEVLTTTLAKFADDPNLVKAATQVRTFTQLIDTMKESVQSGWAQSWEYIIGDSEQATSVLTRISEAFNSIIGPSTEARNAALKFWNENGGRDAMIEAITNAFHALMNIVKPIGEAFRNVFPAITGERLVEISNKIRDLTANFQVSEKTTELIRRTFQGLFSILNVGLKVVGVAVTAFGRVLSILAPLGNVVLSVTAVIGDFFSGLQNGISSLDLSGVSEFLNEIQSELEKLSVLLSTNLGDAITFIGDHAKDAFDIIKDFIDSGIGKAKNVLGDFSDGLNNVVDAVTTFASKVKKAIDTALNAIRNFGSNVKNAFGDVGEEIADAFSDVTLTDAIGTGLLGGIAVAIIKFIKSLKKVKSSFEDVLNGVVDVLDAARGALESWQKSLKADILIKIAGAVALLAASLFVLSRIDPTNLQSGLIGVSVLLAEVVATLEILNKFPIANVKNIVTASTSMIIMSIAISTLASALGSLKEFQSWDETWPALVSLGVLMAGLVASAKVMSKGINGEELIKSSVGLLIFTGAIRNLASAMKAFADLSTGDIIQSLGTLAAILTEISVFIRFSKLDQLKDGRKTILEIAFSMLILYAAVSSFGKMDMDTLGQGLMGVSTMMAALAVSLKAMNNINVSGAAASMVAMASALAILQIPILSMGNMDLPSLAKGLVGVGVSLAAMVGALKVLSGASTGGTALSMMGMALALNSLIIPIKILGSMPFNNLIIGIGGLVTILAALSISAVALAPVSASLISVAGAFALFGVAALGVGAGLMALGVGFSTLAALGTVGATAVVGALYVIATGLAGIIPVIATVLAQGLTVFLTSLAASAPILSEALTSLILTLLSIIQNVVPAVVETFVILIVKLLETLAAHLPDFMQAGFDIIIAILQGIANNIQAVVEAGIQIIVNFINGIAAQLPAVIQAGFNLMISFINGLADGIRNNHQAVMDAIANLFNAIVDTAMDTLQRSIFGFMDIGKNIIEGIKKGISGAINGLLDTVGDMASSALNKAKKVLGIASPSKEFAIIGRFIDLGLVNGLKRYAALPNSEIGNIGSNLIGTMENTNSKIQNVMSGRYRPSIVPVVSDYDISSFRTLPGSVASFYPQIPESAKNIFSNNSLDSNTTQELRDYKAELDTISDEVNSLISIISDLGTKLDSMQVVLDSGALVGGINTKIDQSLGKTTSRKWRHI